MGKPPRLKTRSEKKARPPILENDNVKKATKVNQKLYLNRYVLISLWGDCLFR